MKFSPKCRTKILGMIYTSLESFCSFLNWERDDKNKSIAFTSFVLLLINVQ